ncbi:MAG TPA: glycosyltransferase family 39 protein [Myxococcota bacterium]|nr:glycosyltransferase family 39 protein [Myxococcota bacterium]
MQSSRITALVAATLAFCLAMASGTDCVHIDEHRYTEVSRVMASPGGDWLVPRLNDHVYSDKPPGFFWAAAVAQRLSVNLPLASFLPSVLGSTIALLATFGIGRRFYGEAGGLAAMVGLGSSSEFYIFTGRANLDAFLTGFTTLALYFYVRGDAESERTGSRAKIFFALGCLSAGFGVLVKGPIALAIPGLAVVLARVLEGRTRTLASPVWALALALALAPAGLWMLAAGIHAGADYLETIAFHHAVGHPLGHVDHVQPWSMYAHVYPTRFLPWTVFLPAAFVALPWPLRRPLKQGDALPLAWLVGSFILLSVVPAKREHYLLPLFPGGALLVGRLFADLCRRPASAPNPLRLRWWLTEPLLVGAAVVGALGSVLVIAGAIAAFLGADPTALLPGSVEGKQWWVEFWKIALMTQGRLLALAAVFGLVGLVGSIAMLRGETIERRGLGFAVVMVAYTLFRARALAPALEPSLETRSFVERVGELVGDAPLADYGGIDFAANWVLRRDVVPIFVDSGAASRFMTEHAERGAYLMVMRSRLRQRGMPEGAKIVLEWPRPLDDDLLLLGPASPSS